MDLKLEAEALVARDVGRGVFQVRQGPLHARISPEEARRSTGPDPRTLRPEEAERMSVRPRDGEELVKWVDEQGGAGLATQHLLPGAHIVRAFNAIGSAKVGELGQRKGEVGVPIAGNDPNAIALASGLIKEIGFEPVLVGGLAMGRYLVPGTPLAGEHTPVELKEIASTLKSDKS